MDGYTQGTTEPPKPLPEDEPKEGEAQLASWVEQLDAPNLVPFFLTAGKEGKDFLGNIAEQVCRDCKRGWDNSEEHREQRRKDYIMLTGFLPSKSFPFEGCANAHTPMMFERAFRLIANVFVELFIDRDVIFGVDPVGPDDNETAELLTLHQNFQLRNEITDFIPQQQLGLLEFFVPGSVISYSYRDTRLNRNRHDVLTCEDVIVPYTHTSWQVDMSDVPWKARWVSKYKNELQDLRDSGEWAQVDEVLSKDPPSWDFRETKVRDMGARGEGIVKPEADKSAPYVFYNYHGYTRMPGETRQRPIQVTVNVQHKQVVHFQVREEEDWRDRMRADAQQEELDQHLEDVDNFTKAKQNEEELRMRLQSPDIAPEDAADLSAGLDEEQLPEPQPPPWLGERAMLPPEEQRPDPVKRVPVEMFAHGRCLVNPFGMLGLGLGRVLADLNRLGDESLNRFYDQATLSNVPSLITADGLDLGSSSIAMVPGRVFKAKGMTGESLAKAIHELKPGPANPQLMEVVNYAEARADSSVSAPGILSGEAGKSGETFRGVASRLEQAKKQLSMAGIGYLTYLDQVVKNNAKLNSIFLPEEEIFQVGNHFQSARTGFTKDRQQLTVSRDMYRQTRSISFTADVRFTSQAQRIAEADEVLGMATQTQQLATNNAFVYDAVAECLRARGKQDMIPSLGAKPVPPPEFGMPPAPPPGMVIDPATGQPVPDPMAMGTATPESLAEVDAMTPGSPPVADDGIPRPEAAPGPIQGPQA